MTEEDKEFEKWRQSIDDRQKNYGKECVQELKEDKNFPLSVTPEQAILILEPNHAPENFYCDGEITPDEALANWKGRLLNAGFNPMYVKMIVKYVFG